MIAGTAAVTVFQVPVTLTSKVRNGGDLVPGLGCADPGVGHDDVETAQRGDAVVDGLRSAVEVADVDRRR